MKLQAGYFHRSISKFFYIRKIRRSRSEGRPYEVTSVNGRDFWFYFIPVGNNFKSRHRSQRLLLSRAWKILIWVMKSYCCKGKMSLSLDRCFRICCRKRMLWLILDGRQILSSFAISFTRFEVGFGTLLFRDILFLPLNLIYLC